MQASPIIKWAGGKRQLLDTLRNKVPKFNTYYEPFLGGGALYFDLQPEKAVINDFNVQLINMYEQIRNDYENVCSLLDGYQYYYNTLSNKEEKVKYFYALRDKFNECIKNDMENAESAALFIFLNKAGFNGVYRVNKSGMFNIPTAHKARINLYDRDNICAVSKQLQTAKITSGDFETVCQNAEKDDFVFFDPPYYNTFDTYQAGGFGEKDHIRLSNLFKKLSDRSVKCMLTNSNTDFVKDLYKEFYIEVVSVKRMVNRDATNRTGEEIIVTNYGGLKK